MQVTPSAETGEDDGNNAAGPASFHFFYIESRGIKSLTAWRPFKDNDLMMPCVMLLMGFEAVIDFAEQSMTSEQASLLTPTETLGPSTRLFLLFSHPPALFIHHSAILSFQKWQTHEQDYAEEWA